MKWFLLSNQIGTLLTTRDSGISIIPFDSNNLAYHVGDNPENVLKNRTELANKLGLSPVDFAYMNQVHGAEVVIVNSDSEQTITCDALTTNCINKVLMVMVADCVPILFADTQRKVIGVAHAGWKGTVAQIAQNVINKMAMNYNCNHHDIQVWMGPCIKSCCYNIGKDVVAAFNDNTPYLTKIFKEKSDSIFLDLHECNKQILLQTGVPIQNITIDNTCTSCNTDRFYSHRKENGKTGRFAAGIWIKG